MPHSCKVNDPSSCALCRRDKFYRRLRQNQGMGVVDASRITGRPIQAARARLEYGHLTEYVSQ